MAAVVHLPLPNVGPSSVFLPSAVAPRQQKLNDPSQTPVASTSKGTVSQAQESPTPTKKAAASPKKRKNPSHIVVNGQLQGGDSTERKFVCTIDGCNKAYNRPARLEEHIRSHTDERPYVCNECGASYRRETHLSGHMRTHRPDSDKPLACTYDGCEKRFWTKQHLRRHLSLAHLREKEHQCPECEEAFVKAFQLRAHVAAAHRPEGTLPNICEHPGCGKSFPAPSQLRTHARSHSTKSYACAHESCVNKAEGAPIFTTWSALQKHIKSDHPPTCPHEECNGQRFSTTSHLRRHLTTVHQEAEQLQEGEQPSLRFRRKRYTRARLPEEVETEEDQPEGQTEEDAAEEGFEEHEEESEEEVAPNLGDDKAIESDCDLPWHCIEDQCEESFASAVDFHAHVLHDHSSNTSRKTLACSIPSCTFTARKQHALDRHLNSAHGERSVPAPSVTYVQEGYKNVAGSSALDMLTGHNYGADVQGEEASAEAPENGEPAPKKRRKLQLRYGCPAKNEAGQRFCEQRFWRAYDVERHLKRNHSIDLTRTEVEGLLAALEAEEDGANRVA